MLPLQLIDSSSAETWMDIVSFGMFLTYLDMKDILV